MIIAAHQPNFLPNLAYFAKIAACDLFVIITNLQFEKHEGWQRRHKIKGPNGDIWLTVPVLGSQNQKIADVMINNQVDWRKKHKRTIEMVYAKSKAAEFIPKLVALYEKDWKKLVDLNVAGIFLLKEILDIKTPVVVDEKVSGAKHELLINVCKKYGANTYLSGVGAKDYLDRQKLVEIAKNNIKHQFVEGDLTAQYPYSTIHYLLAFGRKWIGNVI